MPDHMPMILQLAQRRYPPSLEIIHSVRSAESQSLVSLTEALMRTFLLNNHQTSRTADARGTREPMRPRPNSAKQDPFKRPSQTCFLFSARSRKNIEKGAGVGNATLPLLKALSSEEIARLGHYDITDIFAGWLEEAKEFLDEWKTLLSSKDLDIHRDPIQQGLESESYDVVVVVNDACQTHVN